MAGIKRDDEELGPFTEASIVLDDHVVVKKRRGNLVQRLSFDEEDLRTLLGMLDDD